jgi:hypothetical protein
MERGYLRRTTDIPTTDAPGPGLVAAGDAVALDVVAAAFDAST